MINASKVLVLGITFKENCPDIRNSRVIDIIQELKEFEVQVDVFDPWAEALEVKQEYGVNLISESDLDLKSYDGLILAVAHEKFRKMIVAENIDSSTVVYDVKSFLPRSIITARL